jgi:hypothetical protein
MMIQSCTLFLHFSSSSVCLGRKRNGSGLLVLVYGAYEIHVWSTRSRLCGDFCHRRFGNWEWQILHVEEIRQQDIHDIVYIHQQTRVLNYCYIHTLLCTKMWYINDECVVYCSFGSFYFTYALPLPLNICRSFDLCFQFFVRRRKFFLFFSFGFQKLSFCFSCFHPFFGWVNFVVFFNFCVWVFI